MREDKQGEVLVVSALELLNKYYALKLKRNIPIS